MQDIIVSNKWARLVSVLDLLHEGKFDPTSPSVGSLPCPLARKVKVFSHLVFRGFLPETLAKGEALTARLVELFSSFQNHYANVDLVDGPEPITAVYLQSRWSSFNTKQLRSRPAINGRVGGTKPYQTVYMLCINMNVKSGILRDGLCCNFEFC